MERPCDCTGFCDREDKMEPDMFCVAINNWLWANTSAEKPRPCPHGKVWLTGTQVCVCETRLALAVTASPAKER